MVELEEVFFNRNLVDSDEDNEAANETTPPPGHAPPTGVTLAALLSPFKSFPFYLKLGTVHSPKQAKCRACPTISEPQVKSVKTRLECRSGLFLAVSEAGLIQGIEDAESPATVFFLIPVGLRVVALQNESTSGYIAMNSEGRMYTTEFFTPECRFKESVFENYWCLYSSIQYKHPETKRPWHLGINSKGKCIKGMRAKKDRPASHFLPRPIETVMMREPVEADDLLVRSIQPTRSNSFNNEGENDLRMLP